MSLINKMLKDLEARNNASGRVEPPIFQDLHAVSGGRPRRHGRTARVLAVLTVAAIGYFVWDRFLSGPVPQPVSGPQPAVATTPLAPVPATPAPVAVSPPPPVAAHTPESRPHVERATVRAGDQSHEKKSARAKSPTGETGPARIEKTERPYSRDEIAEHAYQEALHAREQGDAAGAESRLQALLAGDSQYKKARELLATVQIENGRWEEAQATLEQGVAQAPAYLPFRMQLARLLLEHKALPQAIDVLDEARRADHADAELLAFLAALQQRAGRNGDAVKSYQDALALKPGEGRWWVGLGIALENGQKSKEAREAYQKGLAVGALPDSLVRYAEDRLKALSH